MDTSLIFFCGVERRGGWWGAVCTYCTCTSHSRRAGTFGKEKGKVGDYVDTIAWQATQCLSILQKLCDIIKPMSPWRRRGSKGKLVITSSYAPEMDTTQIAKRCRQIQTEVGGHIISILHIQSKLVPNSCHRKPNPPPPSPRGGTFFSTIILYC